MCGWRAHGILVFLGVIGVVNFYWFSCWSLLSGVLFVG